MLPPLFQSDMALDAATQARYAALFHHLQVPARTVLLHEGQISQRSYFVVKGCLRVWFNHQGQELTCQFFFEGEGVSSIESFRGQKPSEYNIESIEATELYWIHRDDFHAIQREQQENSAFLRRYMEVTYQRQLHYMHLFFSFIRHTPAERYQRLLEERPDVIRRVPQHYIASYLGITPVSLSRIRNKLLRS